MVRTQISKNTYNIIEVNTSAARIAMAIEIEVLLSIQYSSTSLQRGESQLALTFLDYRFGPVLPLPQPQAEKSDAARESCNRHGKHQGRKQIHCEKNIHAPPGWGRSLRGRTADSNYMAVSATGGRVCDNRVYIYIHTLRGSAHSDRSHRCHVRAHAEIVVKPSIKVTPNKVTPFS